MENKKMKVKQFYDPSEVHINAPLSTIAKMYKNNSFVGDTFFPRRPVAKQTDIIKVYDTAHLKRAMTLREDKTESFAVRRHFGTDLTYRCEGHAVKGAVSEKERKNADPPIQADIDMVELCTDLVLLDKEMEAQGLICATASYPSANHYSTLSAAKQWNNYASPESEPLVHIDTAKEQIYNATGKRANVILLPYVVFLKLASHPDIKDLVKYTHTDLLIDGKIPATLRELKVVVADAMYDSAQFGQTAVLAALWSDYVFIGYVNPNIGIKDTGWGITLEWGGRITRRWFDPSIQADWVEVEEQGYEQKIFDNKCGYLYSDVLA